MLSATFGAVVGVMATLLVYTPIVRWLYKRDQAQRVSAWWRPPDYAVPIERAWHIEDPERGVIVKINNASDSPIHGCRVSLPHQGEAHLLLEEVAVVVPGRTRSEQVRLPIPLADAGEELDIEFELLGRHCCRKAGAGRTQLCRSRRRFRKRRTTAE